MHRRVFDAEHEDFRASTRRFLEQYVQPHYQEFVKNREITRETWRAIGRQGLLGLDVPEALGGVGAKDYRFNAVLIEELAALSLGLASSFSIQFDVVVSYLADLTTGKRREEWLRSLCTGDIVTALAITEPGGGSDVAAVRTLATARGDHFLLNGSKTFITNGYSADLVVVAARTRGSNGCSAGISLFAVEAGEEGYAVGRKLDKVGQPEADTAEIFFHDVCVPAANVMGEVGRGFSYMMERLPRERLGSAVANVAHAATVLSETVEYAKQRQAFGKPVGSFQHNQFLLADLVTRIDVTRAYVDECVLSESRGELTAVDAAKAKWWSAEVQNHVLDACLQIFGGYGYMREYRVAQAWMDGRVTKIWAGSNEIMKRLIGRDLGL